MLPGAMPPPPTDDALRRQERLWKTADAPLSDKRVPPRTDQFNVESGNGHPRPSTRTTHEARCNEFPIDFDLVISTAERIYK